jgi:hypothetical protein
VNKNIRRFATALSLTVVLASTPAIASTTSRDTGADRERPGIVRVIQRLVQKLIGVKTTAEPSIPIPAPSVNP